MPHFALTMINWLTLFEEIIHIYIENNMKNINTNVGVIYC
jgi:hypothetical protein